MNGKCVCIVVADAERDLRDHLQEVLLRMGYEVVTGNDGRQLVELARKHRPDMVIADVHLPDMDGVEAALAINGEMPTPVLLLSEHHDEELIRRAGAPAANVMAWIIKPVSEADLRTAIPLALARFRRMQNLIDEAAALRQTLEERKVIERGKGIVMRRLHLAEADAFLRLRLLASRQNRKVLEICRQVMDADAVFVQVEEVEIKQGG